jgi:hypothetical protein
MSLKSKSCERSLRPLSTLCALGSLTACAAATVPVSAPAPGREPPRQAPGVAVDPLPELPAPESSATAHTTLGTLREPLNAGKARQVVRQFFRAVVAESPDELEQVLAPQASVEAGNVRQPARAFWRSRLLQLDYTVLAGQLLYRDVDLEIYRESDQDALGPSRRLPFRIDPDEIVLRVPITTSWSGRTRLFGDDLVFRLRPAGKTYEIAGIIEDFRLP